MGSEESGDRLVQERGSGSSNLNSVVSDKVSGVTMLYGCNWDPIMSLSQSGNFGNSNMGEFGNPLMLENQFPSDSGVVDLVPSFGSEMVSYNNSESGCNLMLGGVSPSPSPSPSPYGKRKRKAPPSPKNAEEEEQKKNPTSEFISKEEDDEIKQKNGRGKQVGKQAKDNSSPLKDDYIHVRAKRGQATNSHSLAERVRRERISERMRLLQELVPGCNKITGKAMMLDEIINYVQSLQQQVEFLSMKLATVNPQLNMDLDRILSKDILHLRGSNVGINPGFPGYPQGTFNSGPTTSASFHSLPQPHIWNNELQGLLQMGFDPDPSATMGTNGLSKMEL